MCQRAVVRFPCDPQSVRAARSFVASQLGAWGVDEADSASGRVEEIRLVTSELVGNATRFCHGEIEVAIISHRDHVEISVSDDSAQPARLQQPGAEVLGGRGLFIVNALAQKWGQRPRGDGKTVWARLGVPPGSALAVGCRLRLS